MRSLVWFGVGSEHSGVASLLVRLWRNGEQIAVLYYYNRSLSLTYTIFLARKTQALTQALSQRAVVSFVKILVCTQLSPREVVLGMILVTAYHFS